MTILKARVERSRWRWRVEIKHTVITERTSSIPEFESFYFLENYEMTGKNASALEHYCDVAIIVKYTINSVTYYRTGKGMVTTIT